MKKNIAIVFILILFVAYFGTKIFWFPITAIQNSHIEANVPSENEFKRIMNRDLLAYSKTSISASSTLVEFKLLRNGPTQSGTSFPKYYVWLQVFNGENLLKQGAARTAAINQERFQVTDFITSEQIKAAPDEVANVFPKPLVASILELAGVK